MRDSQALKDTPSNLRRVWNKTRSTTGALVALVLVLGTALDSTSTVLIAVPVFAPIFQQLGANLVWVGIITMIAVEVGLITPPLGMSPFIVKASLAGDPLGQRITRNGAVIWPRQLRKPSAISFAVVTRIPFGAVIR